ncbi:MAG: hypothetical protein M3R02_19520 [Chloroflexota bacterium]|nr:hypothetical protein [Chloroflexota bacterium]
MASGFTRYQLRRRAAELDIAVRYGQFAAYIEKGLLPDPDEEPWTEEDIVPRLLRIHELEATVRSLDRRAVVLHLGGYPVPPAKLRLAMVGMLPTIKGPARKMARVEATDRWLAARTKDGSPLDRGEAPPAGWRPPRPAEWAGVLREADLDVFARRLGIERYHAALLAALGKGTPHALADLPAEEALVLLMVRYLAVWGWHQRRARERLEAANPREEPGAPTGDGGRR